MNENNKEETLKESKKLREYLLRLAGVQSQLALVKTINKAKGPANNLLNTATKPLKTISDKAKENSNKVEEFDSRKSEIENEYSINNALKNLKKLESAEFKWYLEAFNQKMKYRVALKLNDLEAMKEANDSINNILDNIIPSLRSNTKSCRMAITNNKIGRKNALDELNSDLHVTNLNRVGKVVTDVAEIAGNKISGVAKVTGNVLRDGKETIINKAYEKQMKLIGILEQQIEKAENNLKVEKDLVI